MIETTNIVIVGAGPYGLSLAAHLRARGLNFRIFGPAMKFWREMPASINLKSLAFATNISVPEEGHTFSEWCRQRDLEDYEPCAMEAFAAYGLWIQNRFVPELEEVLVTNISKSGVNFEVTLSSGRRVSARRVVVSTGLAHLQSHPEVLRDLPRGLARHTCCISDYSEFRGKAVAIIGGGSSAIEAGALVSEAGGTAEIFVRAREAIFHGRTRRERPLWERIREPITVFGAGRKHWILQHFPLLVHFLPEQRRVRLVKNYLGPAAPWWIKDRVLGKVPIHVQSEVTEARAIGNRVRLKVRGPSRVRELEVDRIIAGTGYEWNVSLLPFLAQDIQRGIRRTDRAPRLNLHFESSVEGLYFIGPMSAMSFGPLFRFVAGADFTVRTLARHLGGRLPLSRAWVGQLATVLGPDHKA
jgi:cation diffusion facilitator CzcD-associated flavoprotein CzcO